MAVVLRASCESNNNSNKRRYVDIIKSELEEDEECFEESLEEEILSGSRQSTGSSPKVQMEQEKRMRREIANSNERRRMQSINAGFQSLRGLLPHHEGEKLSKAAILQQTAEYIYQLEQDKNKLATQNLQLKRLVASQSGEGGASVYSSPHSPAVEIPPTIVKRRKTVDGAVESADEGIGNMSPEHSGSGGEDSRSELNELKRETVDLRIQLERERRHRIGLEEQISLLQKQQQTPPPVYPRKFEHDRVQVQTVEEVESFQRVPTPGRVIQDEAPRCYTIRNNLETIVEAIRHLEGDHLFSDDRNNSTPSSTPPSAASPRAMEICSSAGSSPSHSHGQTMIEITPLSLTSAHCPSLGQHQVPQQQQQPQQHHHQQQQLMSGNTFPPTPVSTPVTTLKHHLLNRLARSSEMDDQPINLEFRPVASPPRSPSPVLHQQAQTIPVQFHLQQQQQLRPGVIVVKHS